MRPDPRVPPRRPAVGPPLALGASGPRVGRRPWGSVLWVPPAGALLTPAGSGHAGVPAQRQSGGKGGGVGACPGEDV